MEVTVTSYKTQEILRPEFDLTNHKTRVSDPWNSGQKFGSCVLCWDDLIAEECPNLLIIFTDTSQSQYWLVNERGRYLVFTFANYCWVEMIYEVSIVYDGLLGCNYAHAGYLELSLIVMSLHVTDHFHLCSRWLRWGTDSRVANWSWEACPMLTNFN